MSVIFLQSLTIRTFQGGKELCLFYLQADCSLSLWPLLSQWYPALPQPLPLNPTLSLRPFSIFAAIPAERGTVASPVFTQPGVPGAAGRDSASSRCSGHSLFSGSPGPRQSPALFLSGRLRIQTSFSPPDSSPHPLSLRRAPDPLLF